MTKQESITDRWKMSVKMSGTRAVELFYKMLRTREGQI